MEGMWQIKHHNQSFCDIISTFGSNFFVILNLGENACGKYLTNPMPGFVSQGRNVAN